LTLVGGNGNIIQGPMTIGSRFWTQVSDANKFEKWAANNPVDHHHSVMHGLDLVDDMKIVAEWLGMHIAAFDNINPDNNKD
jgi:hypothetical protein